MVNGTTYINPDIIERLKVIDPSITKAIKKLIKTYNHLVNLIEEEYLQEVNMHRRDLEWLQSKVKKL